MFSVLKIKIALFCAVVKYCSLFGFFLNELFCVRKTHRPNMPQNRPIPKGSSTCEAEFCGQKIFSLCCSSFILRNIYEEVIIMCHSPLRGLHIFKKPQIKKHESTQGWFLSILHGIPSSMVYPFRDGYPFWWVSWDMTETAKTIVTSSVLSGIYFTLDNNTIGSEIRSL